MSKTFIIVGSGISSLTTAIILLKAGHKVSILEQHYVAGGYLHCFKRFGVKYDTGGHYVGAMAKGLPFHKLLNYLGVYDSSDYIELDKDNVDRYNFIDDEYSYVCGLDNNIKKLTSKFPEESDKIKKYFEYMETAAHSFPTYYFKSEYDQSETLKYLDKTLNDVLLEFEICGKLREILIAPCILHGVTPKDVSFGIHSILVDSLMVSSHGFTNGGESLANRFIKVIEKLGGNIQLRTSISKINIENDEVKSIVSSKGKTYSADFYIAGFHPKLVFDMIEKTHLKKSFNNRIKKIEESKSFIGAYLILDKDLGVNPLTNYYFYSSKVEDIFQKANLSRAIFFTTPQRTYSDEGKFPLTLHASCSDEEFKSWKRTNNESLGDDYISFKEDIWKEAFEIIEEKFPGFRKSIIKSCYSTPLTNKFYNPSVNGSAYGIYHDQACTGARSLGPRTHFNNLFLTGQNTLFPGLLGAAISGLRTSGHFVGLKGILKKLEKM